MTNVQISDQTSRRRRRLPAWAVLALVGTGFIATGNAIEASAADDPIPVTLRGSGDTDALAELIDWQNAIFGASQPVDFTYSAVGTTSGRRNLLAGRSDFTMGAVPFTAAELAARPADAGEILSGPVSVASLSIVASTPPGDKNGWGTAVFPPEVGACDPLSDDYDPDAPECQAVRGTFTGPFRVPPESLSALIVGLSISPTQTASSWADAGWVKALGNSTLSIQRTGLHHTFVNRTDGSGQNMYLMQYAKELGPKSWAARIKENPQFSWEPIGETLSPRTRPTRTGSDGQISVMAFSVVDALSNGSPDDWTGNMGAIPTTYVPKLLADFPNSGFKVLEIQNRHGDYLTANKATLDAALAAGTTPNIAATQDVPGAYPLAYVNRLYVVAGSLTPEKANALAASVRYIATDGQQFVVDHGGATLTNALRAEALAFADDIVAKNCTEAGYEVTTSGPSAYEPNTPQVQAIASMQHCTLAPVPTTTTTSTTTTTVAPTTTTVAATTTTVAATTTTVAATTTTTTAVASAAVTTVAPPTTVIYEDDGGGPGNVPQPTYTPVFTPTFTPSASSSSSSGAAGAVDLPTDDTVSDTTVPSETTVPDTTVAEVASLGVTETTVAASSGGGTRPRGVALGNLPMDRPDDGSGGFKQLGTVILGAALFLFGRRMFTGFRSGLTGAM